jgi:alpha(1,3/1,4) fucosyltransferase
MNKIKIAFRYFPRESTKDDDFFRNILANNFNIEETDNPDFVIFSSFNGEKERAMPKIEGDFKKIFWTGENIRVDMKKCDFGFGFEYENEIKSQKYTRLPLYAYYGAGKDLTVKKNPRAIKKQKTKFCNYAYSKDAKERVAFFKELSKYKRIDAPGKSMNNMPPILPRRFNGFIRAIQAIEGAATKNYRLSSIISRHIGNWRRDVINFQKDYKFTIAFENSSYPGYTTEKIYHPMLASSIPVYWGNPEIGRDFNTKSFINYHAHNDMKKVADVVIELDQNEKKYLKMLSQPWFLGNKPNKWCGKERIVREFEKIFGVKTYV